VPDVRCWGVEKSDAEAADATVGDSVAEKPPKGVSEKIQVTLVR